MFKTFAGCENGNIGGVMLFEQLGAASEAGYGGNDQGKLAVFQRFTQISINVQGLREREAGQAAFVFAVCLQGADLVGIACPKGDFIVVVRKVQRESCTPRTCADDGNFHVSLPYGNGAYFKTNGFGVQGRRL